MYGQKDQDTPCESCEVRLQAENKEIFFLYDLIRGQVLVGPAGNVIGLNYSSVLKIFDMQKVKNKNWMFEQVLFCHRIEREIAKEREDKN